LELGPVLLGAVEPCDLPVEVPVGAVEVPVGAVEVPAGVVAAVTVATAVGLDLPPDPHAASASARRVRIKAAPAAPVLLRCVRGIELL
jgi:hypothetical protein